MLLSIAPFQAMRPRDKLRAMQANGIAQPVGVVEMAVRLIRDTESKDVPAIIDALSSIVPAGG
jgi:hypothetical protein